MGKRQKKRGKHSKQSQRTGAELDLIKDDIIEHFEAERAERERATHERAERADVVTLLAREGRKAPAHAGGDSPGDSHFGETDGLVRSPLKPKPHVRSGAIALPEPESEHAILTVSPKLVSK